MVIRKLPGQKAYRVYSKKSHRNLGTYPSKGLAVKREEQVEYFKKKYIKK